jgi:hypothetical protein
VRKKALQIALRMVTNRNVEEVLGLLKKDLVKTVEQDYEKVYSYNTANVRITSIVNFSLTQFILAPSSFLK